MRDPILRPNFDRRRADARRAYRVDLSVAHARLRQQGAHSISVIVRDLSRTGFRAEWPHVIQIGQTFWLTLENLAPLMAKAIWTKDFEVGCRFDVPIHAAVFQGLIGKYGAT